MNTIGFIVTLLAAISYLAEADTFKAFEKGKRYVYEYKTSVLTGVTEGTKQFSGFAFTSLLTVQNDDGDHTAYQISDLKYGLINDKLDPFAEADVDYERLPDERVVHVNNLEKPFWVEYDHGLIKAIYFTKGEDVAKHNNKKALASIFQLDLQAQDQTDPRIFTRTEDSITGVCSNTYMIFKTNATQLKVSKVRKMDSCENSPYLLHTSFQGWEGKDSQSLKPLRTTARVEYTLKGTRNHHTIEHITATGNTDFTPFTSNGQSILSRVKQTFNLLKVEPASSIDKPTDLEKHEYLRYEFTNDFREPSKVDLKEAHYFNRVYPFTDPNHVTKAEDLIEKIGQELLQDYMKISRYIPELINILYEFSYEEFATLYEKYFSTEDRKSLKDILLQVLPKVGTNPAILYTFRLVEEKKVWGKQAAKMIESIPFHVKEPSQRLLEKALEFLSSDVVINSYSLHTASRLAYGSLLYKACNDEVFNPHLQNSRTYISEERCKIHIQEVIDQFRKASTDSERMLYLRTLLNARSQTSNELLMSIIKGNYSTTLRAVAIWDIDYATPEEQVRVSQAYSSVLFNPDEDYVLRAHAFECIWFQDSSPELSSSIIKLLKEDPSEPLKSYIYHFLQSYKNVRQSNKKENIKRVLQFVEERQPNIMTESFDILHVGNNEKYNLASDVRLAFTPGPDSLFPRVIFFGNIYRLLGYSFGAVEVGYLAEGRTVFDDILGLFNFGPSETKSPDKSQFSPELARNAYQKLRHYRESLLQSKPYDIYIPLFSQDVIRIDDLLRYAHDDDSSSDFDTFGLETHFNYKTINYLLAEMVIPNELGMPLSIKGEIPALRYLRGSMVVDSKYKDEKFYHMETDTDLYSGLEMNVLSQVAVMSVLFGPLGFKQTTRAGVYFPFRGEKFLNPETNKIRWTYTPEKEPFDVLYYESIPETIGKEPLKVHYSTHPVKKHFSFGHDSLGLGLTVNLTYEQQNNDYDTLQDFFESLIERPESYIKSDNLREQIHAGLQNLRNYALFTPTAKPISLNIRYSKSSKNPAGDFRLVTSEDFAKDFNDEIDSKRGQRDESFKTEIETNGRKWNIKLGHSTSWPDKNYRESYFRLKRSPLHAIHGYDVQPFELYYTSNSSVTNLKDIYHIKPSDVKFVFEEHLTMGQECGGNAQQMFSKVVAQQSEEQKKLDRKDLPFYKKCQEFIAKNPSSLNSVGNINYDCWQSIVDLGRLDKVKIEIDYKNAQQKVKNVFLRLTEFLRHRFYNHLEVDSSSKMQSTDRIEIDANISYSRHILDVTVKTPREASYKGINMLSVCSNFEPFSVAESWKDRLYRKSIDYTAPFCFLSGNSIRTFDDVTYTTSLSKDYHLALTDLQSLHVLFRSVNTAGQLNKALYAYMNGLSVEIVPNDKSLEVKVNGKSALEEETTYVHKENDKITAIVSKHEEGIIVTHEVYGIEIYFDGHNSIIRGSYLYKGRQHGLCGNLDGNKHNEFQGADGKIYENVRDFTTSYIVEGATT